MSALNLIATTGEIAVSSVAKTFLTVKSAANQRVKIKGIEVFGKGTNPTDTPVKIEIGTITTDGQTASATQVTPIALDGDAAETPQTIFYASYSTEPTTYGKIARVWEVHPQTSLIVYFPEGQEIILKGGTELGIRLTSTEAEIMSLNLLIEE